MDHPNNAEQLPQRAAYPSIGQAFLLTLIFIAFTIAVAIPVELLGSFWPAFKENLALPLGYIIPAMLTIWFAQRMKGDKELAFREVAPAVYFLSVPILIGIALVLEPLVNLIPVPDFFIEIFRELFRAPPVVTFITIVVAPALLEEILLRGIVLEGFLRRYDPWKAILWSAFIFGIMHLNPWQFIPAFALGIYFGWLYWKTRSLLPCILLHGLNNFIGWLAYYLTGDLTGSTRDLFSSDAAYLGAILAFAGLGLGSWVLLRGRAG